MKNLFNFKTIPVAILILLAVCDVSIAQRTRIEIEKFRYTNDVTFTGPHTAQGSVTISNTSLNSYTNPNLNVYGSTVLGTTHVSHTYFGFYTNPLAYIDQTNGLVMSSGSGITLGGERRATWPFPGYVTNFSLAIWASFTSNDSPVAISSHLNRVFYPWTSNSPAGKFATSFNVTNGIFTTPQSGYYEFMATVMGINNTDNASDPPRDFFISVGGNKDVYLSTAEKSTQSGYIHSRFLYLESGVEVSVRMFHESTAIPFRPRLGEFVGFYYGVKPWEDLP